MTREEAKSCIGTIEMLQRLAYNIHGVMDVIDADNCKKIIKMLEQDPSYNSVKTELEPCEDNNLVSRQAVLEVIRKCHCEEWVKADIGAPIEALQSVTPQPKMGHWIKTPKAVMGEGYMWYCDKCEHKVYQDSSKPYPSEKYCPNCGQPKMQEVKE